MKLDHNATLPTDSHFADEQESSVKQTQSNPSDVARFNNILKEKTEKSSTSSGKSAPTQEKIISALKKGFTSRFEHVAKDSKNFHALLNQAFGSSYDHEAAETIRHKATQGDFSWLPDTKIVSGNEFADAQLTGGDTGSFLGAFDGDSVLLNQEVLSDSNLAKSVYAEEAGHALDKLVNKGADAEGDEGAIFQKSLFGEKISADQLTALKSENDHGVLGGREVEFDKLVPSFQPSIYMRADDMKKAFEHGGGLEGIYNHWQKHGIHEGRRASIEFDVQYYLSQYADLREAFGNDYKAAHDHWLQHGLNEGRKGSADFDVKYYLAQYADLREAFGADNKAALQHWLEYGIKEGRSGSIKSDLHANIFAVAYQNSKQGMEGAAEDLKTLKQVVANKDQGEAAQKALEAIVTKITDRNSTLDKAGLDAAIAAYDKDIAKSKASTHLMADVSRLVKLVTYNVATKDAAGHEGAQARKTNLLKSLADKDTTAFTKAASAILEKNPDVTVEWIDGELATWYDAHKYAGKADENATTTAFNKFVSRAKVEAHFKGDVRRIVALAANNEIAGIEGAKEANVVLKQSLIDQDNEAFNQATTTVLALRPGPEITKEWIDGDLTNWYGATDYEGKAEVDAATTAFIAKREVTAHFKGNIEHIIALAAQNEVSGLDGAKERKAELLKSIVDKDNVAVAKVGQEILAQNPELTVETIDGTVAWHKDYVTQIQDAQKHLMSDAKLAVALAAHNEINGVEGAHARSEALKESLANKDVTAFNKVIAEIIVENPHLSVKWIDGDLATWHAETEYADKAAIDATATAFNAFANRAKVEAHFMGDIRRIVALAANNEIAGIEGAKEVNIALKQSIIDQDNDAFNQAAIKVLELRPGPEINKEWIDTDLTNWYGATDYEGKAEVDAATTAFIAKREVKAHFMGNIEHMVALAAQNEVKGIDGAKERKAELLKSIADNDNAAVTKVGQEILVQNPDLTTEVIDGTVAWHKNYVTQIQDAQKHLMSDAKRAVALAAHNEINGVEGAHARSEALKESLANQDIAAFNKVIAEIIVENPHLSVKWIDGDLATWHAETEYADKAAIDETATAFNASIARTEVEAHFRGDIRRIVALAANNEIAGIEGSKEVNVALKQSITDQNNEAFNQAATKVLELRPGPEITKEWIDTDLTNWYGATDYEGKAEVDAATTAFIARREAETHFMGNIEHIIALATQNDVEGLDGAKERKAELLKSIADKDNNGVTKVGQEILAQNPDLTVEIIDGTVAWHKDYVTQIQDAQKYLMSDAKRAVALAAHNEINGVEGAHARSEALKESLANQDIAAFNKVIAEIVEEYPEISVEWIDGNLATWHAETEYAGKAELDASATAFNASITRSKVEAHFMGDIRRIVALAANNEIAGIEGAKEVNVELKQSIVDMDNKAFNQAMAEVLALRTGPEITKEWIDTDLTNWYGATDYESKAEVDAATTAFIARREVQAYFMADINHVAAIALQNELDELPGAQERYDALREAALAKDQAAIDKASLEIFAHNPGMTIDSIDDAVSEGNDILQNG